MWKNTASFAPATAKKKATVKNKTGFGSALAKVWSFTCSKTSRRKIWASSNTSPANMPGGRYRPGAISSFTASTWHLLLAHQCPWHAKAARALAETARETGIDLHIREIRSAKEAQHAPSGFGVFALLHDGKLLADHYVSRTRFRNIIRAEGCLR